MSGVVVHGVGAVGAFGNGWRALAEALRQPPGAVVPASEALADGTPLRVYRAAVTPLDRHVPPAALRRVDFFSRLVTLGCCLALQDAGAQAMDRRRIGLIVASGYGANATTFRFFDTCLDYGDAGGSPTLFSGSGHAGGLSQASILLGLTGPGLTLCQHGLAWTMAMAAARGWLVRGRADLVLVCAVEECFPLLLYVHARKHGGQACGPIEPFEFGRQSAVPGEGCACLALARPGVLATPPLGQVKRIEVLDRRQAPAVQGVDALLLAADGQRDTAAGYADLPDAVPMRSFAPVFGSLPTGVAMAAAGQLAAHRGGITVHAGFERHHRVAPAPLATVCCFECAVTGEAGAVTIGLGACRDGDPA